MPSQPLLLIGRSRRNGWPTLQMRHTKSAKDQANSPWTHIASVAAGSRGRCELARCAGAAAASLDERGAAASKLSIRLIGIHAGTRCWRAVNRSRARRYRRVVAWARTAETAVYFKASYGDCFCRLDERSGSAIVPKAFGSPWQIGDAEDQMGKGSNCSERSWRSHGAAINALVAAEKTGYGRKQPVLSRRPGGLDRHRAVDVSEAPRSEFERPVGVNCMQPLDFAIAAVLTVLMILGAYQVYLFPQRRLYFRERNLQTAVDDWIPFRPGWVWIYACAYYPFIVSLVIIADSWERYVYMAFSFAMLLLLHLSIAVLVPVRTPREWREWKSNGTVGERFLRFIQSVDKGGNCFPSMHVAVAMLAGLHIRDILWRPEVPPHTWCGSFPWRSRRRPYLQSSTIFLMSLRGQFWR